MENLAPRRTQKMVLGSFGICIIGFYCFMTSNLRESYSVSLAPCAANTYRSNNSQKTPQRSEEHQACQPKLNLMFMKTHKTASSTLMNILLRFGEKNKLRFALPDGRNDFFYPSNFFRTQVKAYEPGVCYNIVCNHMRFNAMEVEKLLPQDTFYFTILRDPAELFESSFHYYKGYVPQTWRIPGENQIEEFLQNPKQYFNPKGINQFYLKNLQFFDLGFENTMEADDPRVKQAIRFIEERFDLILISDYFEESLILLKDALCWEIEDVLFFKHNVRSPQSGLGMSPQLKFQAREWNGADWLLYQYFNASLWARIEKFGLRRMLENVQDLRRKLAEMEELCIDGGHAVEAQHISDGLLKPWQPLGSASILGYNLRSPMNPGQQEVCRKMLTPEIQYLSSLGVDLWLTRLWGWLGDSLALFRLS
ncbi:hypothetical protein DNTS_025175 [Danionella cerebrum]|uniref:Galactose-3-O-sulfotransferase 1 n=1 Tax=Danionella cerebrum TaxID=2873325 RepID=A0A553QCA4_9TELE|nr:hypothetical protein DNTS_025175 [Danionella translucida]